MDDPNNQNINQDETGPQDRTGNMYSYRDNNNIRNSFEGGAIRRSLGEGNPNINNMENNFGTGYGQNYINNGNVGIQYSQENNNIIIKRSIFWLTFLLIGIIEGIILVLLIIFFEYKIKFDLQNIF